MAEYIRKIWLEFTQSKLEKPDFTREEWALYATAHTQALASLFPNDEWHRISNLWWRDNLENLSEEEKTLQYERGAVLACKFALDFAAMPKLEYQEIAERLLWIPYIVNANLSTLFPNQKLKIVRLPQNLSDFRD